jgi:hypothetical protein
MSLRILALVGGKHQLGCFYLHTTDNLDVIRVLHGRRDLASLLRQEKTAPASLRALQEQARRSGTERSSDVA